MPRFSDIFCFENSVSTEDNRIIFSTCYLLKSVGPHQIQKKFDSVTFDIAGMVLFLVDGEKVSGPFTLSTSC